MSHYFDPKPDASHQIAELSLRIQGTDFVFHTDSGVFSRRRLDFGSESLIEAVIKDLGKPRGRLLDLGCGYGAVGIILKRLYPALEVVLCDINERALDLARHNAEANQVRFLEIVQSDGLQSVTGHFDLILTNPPIRAGKATVYRFFDESARRLRPGGWLYVVIRKNQGAPSARKHLQALFSQVAVIDHAAGYWVLRAGPAIASAAKDMIQ